MRDYVVPLVLALLLHAGVATALVRNWERAPEPPRQVRMPSIEAKLLVMEKPEAPPPMPSAPAEPPPQPKPAAPPPKPKPSPTPPPKPRQERDAEAERRAEEERKRAEREARLRALDEESTFSTLEEEAAALAHSASERAAMSYMHAIRRAIIRQWSRPPSARNGMQARLEIMLAPTGELLSVALLDSSGNSAFDRSAEQAVHRVRRFEVPGDRRLFEAEFRRFTMLFRPEDLLR